MRTARMGEKAAVATKKTQTDLLSMQARPGRKYTWNEVE